jgi:1-acyl-sn-glycerol-3-phosphate acyltransferase
MKLVKAILGRVWAAWGLLAFVSTMILFLIPFLLLCYFLPEPKKTLRFVTLSRGWMAVFLNLIGCPLSVRGKDNFAKGKNYIVLCNHNSLMDIPVSSPAIPGGNKTIAKIEMAKIPLFGMIYRTGSVLVDRKSEESRKESYNRMKKVLAMGLHMCIYPEGTRNKTAQPLKSFHDGAFRLALDTRKSIIPAIIFNTKKALPADKSFYLAPHKLEIHFLPPIKIATKETPATLKEKVFEVMKKYYLVNSRKSNA